MLDESGHDHEKCRRDALERAEQQCRSRGLRLTAQRRQVLDVMLRSHTPVTAYEIIDRIAETAHRPSPISVYRALDFLTANRFVHRIESRNAFLACSAEHSESDASGRRPALVFLLCERCGNTIEAESSGLGTVLDGMASSAGYSISSSVLEVRGLCPGCRAVADGKTS